MIFLRLIRRLLIEIMISIKLIAISVPLYLGTTLLLFGFQAEPMSIAPVTWGDIHHIVTQLTPYQLGQVMLFIYGGNAVLRIALHIINTDVEKVTLIRSLRDNIGEPK